MQFLRKILDAQGKHFHEGGKLERYFYAFEAIDTLLYTPGETSRGASHVRDALDLKRMMITVVIALIPAWIFGMWNTGNQAHLAMVAGAVPLDNWQEALYAMLGLSFAPDDFLACFVHGAIYFLPIYIVTLVVGGHWEMLFAIVRKHPVTEGFLVTSALIPCIVPATLPLWQLVLAVSFGVVIGKEVFGGVGMNFLNPALVVRAFLFFAYPAQISGDLVWIPADFSAVDTFSGATWLAEAAVNAEFLADKDWWQAFWGFIPGSMCETSTAVLLFGAFILIATGVGSWRTMLGVVVGTAATALLFNTVGSDTNPMFSIPVEWHFVLGGWALGAIFMATDPVSSAFTDTGKLWYGFLIGVMCVLVRTVNPAYPEGMMLAILFMNMFAPLIDHFIVQANIKRREARYAGV